jgi:hypothetical protein
MYFPRLLFPVLFLLPFPNLAAQQNSQGRGVEMTIRRTAYGNTTEEKDYVLPDRKRMEFRNEEGRRKDDGSLETVVGPPLVAITRCDLGKRFELNLDDREYTAAVFPHPTTLTKEQQEAQGSTHGDSAEASAPTLRIETTTFDTGERKDFFGHVARHVATTRKEVPLGGSHAEPKETQEDGWYIDLQPWVACEPMARVSKNAHGYIALGTYREVPQFVDVGEREFGFAVELVVTTRGYYQLQDGARKEFDSKTAMAISRFQEGPIDSALFEIPPGFKRVDRIERNPQTTIGSPGPTGSTGR